MTDSECLSDAAHNRRILGQANWAGKLCLVTGATGAFGSATATALADAGATVVLSGKSIKALEKLYDKLLAIGAPEPAIFPIDFIGAQGHDYQQLADAIEKLGKLELMVWCAGNWPGMEALANVQMETWFRCMHLNSSAPYLLFRALFDQLRANRGTAAFALQSAEVCELAFAGPYGVAQAALRNWVDKAANENERLLPKVLGLELPPLKSKLRLQAFPAESLSKVIDPTLLMSSLLTTLSLPAGSYRLLPESETACA